MSHQPENDTAIVEVAGLGQVELRVQDLTNVSLVISEVDCFKYLGLNLDYALRMEEATKAGSQIFALRTQKCPPLYIAYINYHGGVTMRRYHLLCVSRCGDRVFSRKLWRISGTYVQKVKSNSGKQLCLSP